MDKKQDRRLHYGRLTTVEHKRRELYADIPAGTAVEDILKPDYWVHYAAEIRPLDIIECFCEDGSWEASLRVFFVSTTEVKAQLRSKTLYNAKEEVSDSDTHEVVWKGPSNKFAVVHKGTKAVVKDGLYPKDKAFEFLREHLQAVA